jgi:endonuclease/exonuclease/phosphatase family metal-dependent hydrolase
MRIASFNVDSLDVQPKAAVALDDRIAILRPQLARLRADVLCLQEINSQRRPGAAQRSLEALDSLLAGTPYQAYARAVSSPASDGGLADVHNLVTLSRWPIAGSRSVRNALVPALSYRPLTACPPSDTPQLVAFERPILVSDIEVGSSRVVTVVNMHLRASLASPIAGQKDSAFVWKSVSGWAEGYALAAWKRTAQALEARMVVDGLMDADPQRTIIVAGDFNAEDHETPLKILVGGEEDTGNGRLASRSLVVLDRSLPADLRFSALYHGRPQMLDHILVNRAGLAKFRKIEVHNETLSDELIAYGKTRHEASSFHAPVVAEFDLD